MHIPKKDQCEQCESYKNSSATEKLEMQDAYDKHLIEKELVRSEKKRDKERAKVDPTYIVSSFDLESVLPCPRGEVSAFFYRSKLNCYNLTIYNLATKVIDAYVWTEVDARRGAEEIGSHVHKYLCSLPHLHGEQYDVVLYTDNCPGQQKNQFLVALYCYEVQKLPHIRTITHKFLVRGHTQNEGDCAHSLIEKETKRFLKGSPIYVPDQYIDIIKNAKKNGQPINVHKFNHLDFYSIKDLAETMNLNVAKIRVSEICQMRFRKQNPFSVEVKYSFDGEAQTFNLQKRGSQMPSLELKRGLFEARPLPAEKYDDLMYLVDQKFIPLQFKPFYETLKKV